MHTLVFFILIQIVESVEAADQTLPLLNMPHIHDARLTRQGRESWLL